MRLLPVLLLLLFPALNVSAEVSYIYCGQVLDVRSGDLLSEQTLVIEDGKISRMAEGFIPTGEGKPVDLRRHTCLPGLMDMHTHLSSQMSQGSYSENFTKNPGYYAFKMVGYAEKTLLAGFTTVRDLGDRFNLTVSLRDAITAGTLVGPRIFTAAKAIATTGGHADPSNGYRFDLMGDPGPADGVVNGVADARKAVRQRYKDGADLIKITATGGVLSVAKNGQNPQFNEEEIRAIVATAADYEMGVAAHAHGAEGMKRAIRAGVRSIEHGTLMDAEVMRLMKEHGTFYVPTILAGKWVAAKAEIEGFFPELVRPKAAALGPVIQETVRKAYKAGVKIAFGTDSGVSAHGDNGQEFRHMVDAGIPAAEAIRMATLNAAQLLGIEGRLGTLEVGKVADVVAVPGNPLQEIGVMEKVAFVMKDGVIYKQP
jgi:imidazolonepropionase-like amidohydrolase